MITPIIIFKNQQQAQNCLFEWQNKLSLFDWIININLLYDEIVTAPNWGSSTNWRAMHIAEIYIPMPQAGQINPFPQKYCQELILVHELLHIRIPKSRVNVNSNEGNYYQAEQHATLESIAKALIMAKYDVNIDWFYNF